MAQSTLDFVLDAFLDAVRHRLASPIAKLIELEAELRDGDRFGFQEVAGENVSMEDVINQRASASFHTLVVKLRDAATALMVAIQTSGWACASTASALELEAVSDIVGTISNEDALATVTLTDARERRHHIVIIPGFAWSDDRSRHVFVSPGYSTELLVNVSRDKALAAGSKPVAAALAAFEDILEAAEREALVDPSSVAGEPANPPVL